MLVQVATPKTVGKVSGLGWGLGYIGGIVALMIVVVLTFADWFGMDTSNGMVYRIIAVGCAVWAILFSLPLWFNVPEAPPSAQREKVGFFQSYGVLIKDIVKLYRRAATRSGSSSRARSTGMGWSACSHSARFWRRAPSASPRTRCSSSGSRRTSWPESAPSSPGRFDDRFGPRAVVLTALYRTRRGRTGRPLPTMGARSSSGCSVCC